MSLNKKKMEIGVLAMLRKDHNPFEPLLQYGVKAAQVQCWDMELIRDLKYAKTVKKQISDAGIRLAGFWGGYSGRIVWNSYGGPNTCGLVPRDLRAKRVDELKYGADFAKAIGAPALITHCGFIPENPMDPLYPETLNAIFEVAQHCHDSGIDFWFESGQETPLTLLRTIEDINLPNLGVNLDTANLILYGRGNPVDALDVIGPYVRNLHVKDGLFPTNGKYLGKEVRQSGMDTVKLHHTIKDIQTLRPILTTAELLVRVNPIHDKIGQVESSKEEIDNAINAGADILMLPMVKTKQEAEKFVEFVGGRAKTMLLIETAEANENIDQILEVQGIDEIHVGLNDMHLAYKKRFKSSNNFKRK